MPASSQASHQRTIAHAYADAIADPSKRYPVTDHVRRLMAQWLQSQKLEIIKLGIRPTFVDREVPLEQAIKWIQASIRTKGQVAVPVSALHNEDPHPIWSPVDNLWFRLVHDYHHYVTGADASFSGELAVTKHCLDGVTEEPIRRVLASEIIGQAAYRLEYREFPTQQIIAANILDLI